MIKLNLISIELRNDIYPRLNTQVDGYIWLIGLREVEVGVGGFMLSVRQRCG